mgnify:CR=1 FL=1
MSEGRGNHISTKGNTRSQSCSASQSDKCLAAECGSSVGGSSSGTGASVALTALFGLVPARRWSGDAFVARLVAVSGVIVLVALTRWQAVHLLPADWFYRILTVHGMSMLIFFIIFFEMAVLWFVSTVLLNARPAAPR